MPPLVKMEEVVADEQIFLIATLFNRDKPCFPVSNLLGNLEGMVSGHLC